MHVAHSRDADAFDKRVGNRFSFSRRCDAPEGGQLALKACFYVYVMRNAKVELSAFGIDDRGLSTMMFIIMLGMVRCCTSSFFCGSPSCVIDRAQKR